MKNTLEHVNLTVRDAKRTAKMLCDVFDWKVRWHGPTIKDGYSYHVGTDDFYIALYAPAAAKGEQPDSLATVGRLNHIGIVVDDLDAAERRVLAAGLKPQSHQDYEPGRRFYFYDQDKVEYEVVSYA